MIDEDVQKEIMAQEEGFQKQSKLFQRYLQNEDESSGGDAACVMLREHPPLQECSRM